MTTNGNHRLLAAIMFTDMVGYTALMQENEHQAKVNRDRHRKVQQEACHRHSGKILQYYGDGTLVIFNSAIEAVSCAVEIQTELKKEPVINLRIGMHTGDIVYDDEGVYGDSVNIASRIEGLAVSGSVLISGKLTDEIKNQPEFSTKLLDAFNLKNVKEPVDVYAITNDPLTVPDAGKLRSNPHQKVKSIAVLPFVNMSSDPENEYFSDGITEEILNALCKVDGLQVTARTSSFAFKGMNRDIREIGRELGVKTVLEGSVRKAGNRVRITAQLISMADGYHIWSDTYDRHLEDIFQVQDEISLKITNKLREKLCRDQDKKKMVVPATTNLEAYNLYLKAIFYYSKWTLEDCRIAIDLLNQALELDPEYALAMAGLSKIYGFMGASGKVSPQSVYPLAKEYAIKANELDQHLPETHLALANSCFWLEQDWEGADRHIREAIKLNPSFAEAYMFKAMFLLASATPLEACEAAQTSLQLDPLSSPSAILLAFSFFSIPDWDKAYQEADKLLVHNPNFIEALNLKGWVHTEKGEFQKALDVFETVKNIKGNESDYLMGVAMVYGRKGDIENARKYLELLLDLKKNVPDISIEYKIGLVYAEMGDADNMFNHFFKSHEKREGDVIFLNNLHCLRKYRQDPRFDELNRRMGRPVRVAQNR